MFIKFLIKDIYHTTFNWPAETSVQERLVIPPLNTEEDLINRLVLYNRNIASVQESLKATAKTINVDQPIGDIFNQSLFVS
jgi:adenylate kinase